MSRKRKLPGAPAAYSRPAADGADDPGAGRDGGAPAAVADKPSAGRADLAVRYPADYRPTAGPLPGVDGPHERPGRWAGDISPGRDAPGRDNNCGACSRAVDSMWNGTPAAAAAMRDQDAPGEPVARMAEWAGQAPERATMGEIGQRLRDMGPGSSAVVGCGWKHGGGHWFNAVNDAGAVTAVDGQSGRTQPWPPSAAGLGFDEGDMRYSDAIFFTADGKVATR